MLVSQLCFSVLLPVGVCDLCCGTPRSGGKSTATSILLLLCQAAPLLISGHWGFSGLAGSQKSFPVSALLHILPRGTFYSTLPLSSPAAFAESCCEAAVPVGSGLCLCRHIFLCTPCQQQRCGHKQLLRDTHGCFPFVPVRTLSSPAGTARSRAGESCGRRAGGPESCFTGAVTPLSWGIGQHRCICLRESVFSVSLQKASGSKPWWCRVTG